MSDYTRDATVHIAELVPARDQLPRCGAWQENLYQCWRKARYEQDGLPVCGLHVGRPGLLWHKNVEKAQPTIVRKLTKSA